MKPPIAFAWPIFAASAIVPATGLERDGCIAVEIGSGLGDGGTHELRPLHSDCTDTAGETAPVPPDTVFCNDPEVSQGPTVEEAPLDYQAWEYENGIGGAGASADSDGDGIPNGIEFVIGGDPSSPGSNSNSLLPTVTVDAEFMYFIFRRTDDAAGYDPFVEYSGNANQWIPAEPGVDGVFIEDAADFYGPGVARVTVRIPRNLASGPVLFGRLKVKITP